MNGSRKNFFALITCTWVYTSVFAGNIYFRLTLVAMGIESIAATDHKGYDTKYLQIKQEHGGIYPAIGNVLQFWVFYLYGCLLLDP